MRHIIKLTPRLQAVADCVPAGAVLCDVGTDHAHLPAYLLQEGRIVSAIASDIRKGPLERAAATREKCHLENQIELRLGPGLEAIRPNEVNTVTICGMGGEMMIGILSAAPWTKVNTTLILQPQSAQEELRYWLRDHGYRILQERIVREEQRWYTVMKVIGGEMALPLGPVEALTGHPSLWAEHPEWPDFLTWLIRKLEKQRAGMEKSSRKEEQQRAEELTQRMDQLTLWRERLQKGEWPL